MSFAYVVIEGLALVALGLFVVCVIDAIRK